LGSRDADGPIVITADGDENFLTLLMPTRCSWARQEAA
jgi:hypothetical protein